MSSIGLKLMKIEQIKKVRFFPVTVSPCVGAGSDAVKQNTSVPDTAYPELRGTLPLKILGKAGLKILWEARLKILLVKKIQNIKQEKSDTVLETKHYLIKF